MTIFSKFPMEPKSVEKSDDTEDEVPKEPEDDENKDKEPEPSEWKSGWSRLTIHVGKRSKCLSWHEKGDYLASVASEQSSSLVLIHRLTKQHSQSPFAKAKGLIQRVLFHPNKPFFIVATQRHIRVYHLVKQQLIKSLTAPARWISSLAIHPGGDHIIIGSYDCKVCWYDLDQATTPYKTLKYHTKAVRSVDFHNSYPLFATASDDGKVHIFHDTVYSDLQTNPLIVPVKVLNAHKPIQDLGVLDCIFHPQQPWIFTAGADQVIRLFT